MRKIYFFCISVLLAVSLTGCSYLFPYQETSAPDNSDVVTVGMTKVNMAIGSMPEAVEEYVSQVDPTLYNALSFISTNGLDKVRVLTENRYFNYEPLETADIEAINDLTEKTNVSFTAYDSAGRTNWKMGGSCSIFKITEDYVYLLTAGHCIGSDSILKYSRITFWDRTYADVSLCDHVKWGGFNSKQGDVAMFRVPTSDIPYDILINLQETCFDKTQAENVKVKDKVFTGNIYFRKQSEDYDKTMTVIDESNSELSELIERYPMYVTDPYFVTDTKSVKGQSGSAVFNDKGYVVGVVSGTYRSIGLYANSSIAYELMAKYDSE